MKNINWQNGAATLFMSLIILFLMTFILIFAAKSLLFDKKVTSNYLRYKQAFETAESGINYAYDNYDGTGTGFPCEKSLNDSSCGSVVSTISLDPAFSVDVSSGTATSVGYSDDRTAKVTINERIKLLSPLPNVPANPFTGRSNLLFSGSASVYNPEGNSTIWSGKNTDLSNTQTFIADPSQGTYPVCLDTAVTCKTTQTTTHSNVGLDVVENDDNLGNLTGNEFFENFFGLTKTAFKSSGLLTRPVLTSSEFPPPSGDSNPNLLNEIVWVDGDASIGAGDLLGCNTVSYSGGGYDKITSSTCGDSPLTPSLIIVDGDLNISGGPSIYGLLYVTGDITGPSGAGGGNLLVEGAVLVENNSNTSGNITVIYNSDMLDIIKENGDYSGIPGTWRDF